MLKPKSGKIIKGEWVNTTQAALLNGVYNVSSFKFYKNDIEFLVTETISDIKFTGSDNHGFQSEINKKNENNISKIAKVLLSK